MKIDVYTTVKDCRKCVRNEDFEKHRRQVQTFPASGALEFVTRDILGRLPKSQWETKLFSWCQIVTRSRGELFQCRRRLPRPLPQYLWTIGLFHLKYPTLCWRMMEHSFSVCSSSRFGPVGKEISNDNGVSCPGESASRKIKHEDYRKSKALPAVTPRRIGHSWAAVDICLWFAKELIDESTATHFNPVMAASRPYNTPLSYGVPTDPTVTTSLHVLWTWLLHRLSTMRLEEHKRMKKAPCRYKWDHNRHIRNGTKMIEVGQYVSLDPYHQWQPLLQRDWRLIRTVG